MDDETVRLSYPTISNIAKTSTLAFVKSTAIQSLKDLSKSVKEESLKNELISEVEKLERK